MARKSPARIPASRPPPLIAIEQLGRLIQAGTAAARVTRATQLIVDGWRTTAGSDAAREWAVTLHADLASGTAEAEEQAGDADRDDVGVMRQAGAVLAALQAARDTVAAEMVLL